MAYSPVALITPQYENYQNYWLKAYQQGTTTPLAMSVDAAGTTTSAKFEINSNGFPITAGNAMIIPHIEGDYDLWLFPTAAEADANDTTNALQFADNLNAGFTASAQIELSTLAAMKAYEPPVSGSVSVYVLGRTTAADGGEGNWIWLVGDYSSQVAADTLEGVWAESDSVASTVGAWYRPHIITSVGYFGAKGDGVTDDTAAVQAAHNYVASVGSEFSDVLFPAGVYLTSSLTWSSIITARSDGKVVLLSSISSGNFLHISTEFGNWPTVAEQISYAGNTVFRGDFVIKNTLGSALNSAYGIWFGDDNAVPQAYSAESITLQGIRIEGWANGFGYGSHAYLISVKDSQIRNCGNALYLDDAPYIDRIERVSFDNCTINNCTNVIDGVAGVGGDLTFINCSFDYNVRVLASFLSQLVLNFTGGCHFEWDSTDALFSMDGCSVNLSNYYVFFFGVTPPLTAVASVGNVSHVKSFEATFNTPAATALFTLGSASAEITAEVAYKQFGGASTYINNVGAGIVNGYVDVLGATGYTKFPNGLIRQWGTMPSTAVGAGLSVNITVTFPLAFPTACTYANAVGQPSASGDVYGFTQRVITGTPTQTTTFAYRNGGTAQNLINATYEAIGY